MSGVIVRLPGSLHRRIRELAKQDEISINQFIATVVAEKVAALLTVEYLEERGRRADPRSVDRILQRVPDVAAAPGDELPPVRTESKTARHPTKARRQITQKRTKGVRPA